MHKYCLRLTISYFSQMEDRVKNGDTERVLSQISSLQTRVAGLETRAITREDFLLQQTVRDIRFPKTSMERAKFITLPSSWVPHHIYYRKPDDKEPPVHRACVPVDKVDWSVDMDAYAPVEYESEKMLGSSFADPSKCDDEKFSRELRARFAHRVVPIQIDAVTCRPLVRCAKWHL